MSTLDPAAYVVALAHLPGIGPASLYRLVTEGEPLAVWEGVLGGRITRPPSRRQPTGGQQLSLATSEVARQRVVTGRGTFADRSPQSWARAAANLDPRRLWRRCQDLGINVTWPGCSTYPAKLRTDPEPPGTLFWRGRLDHLDRVCVAVVGTRRCTPDGRATALLLGRDLSEAGVCVVSGLALGIDGAAHAGALEASKSAPVGVVASGVDLPYPRQHAALWARVTQAGSILSETPPGSPAQAWRFPARNRIIAGLADLVVVVESHAAGGAMLTADAAIARGVEVRAVPGPVRSPASAGTNQLLFDGPGPVRHAGDVLDALGLIRPAYSGPPGPGSAGPLAYEKLDGGVLDAVTYRPEAIGRIVARTGLDLGRVARELDRLEGAGAVSRSGDWWVRT